jgi:hypothetical protein
MTQLTNAALEDAGYSLQQSGMGYEDWQRYPTGWGLDGQARTERITRDEENDTWSAMVVHDINGSSEDVPYEASTSGSLDHCMKWVDADRNANPPRRQRRMQIYIARISHKYGTDLYPGVTEADVDKDVQEYVRENWDKNDHGEMPDDPAKAVDAYFQAEQENGLDPEWLEIGPYDLEGDIRAALETFEKNKGKPTLERPHIRPVPEE